MWDGSPSSCQIPCQGNSSSQVCQSTDCKAVPFLVFEEQGTHWAGTYLYSQSLRKLTLLTSPRQTQWRGSVSQGVEIKNTEGEFSSVDMACEAEEAIAVSKILFDRTPDDRSKAVQSILTSENRPEVSY